MDRRRREKGGRDARVRIAQDAVESFGGDSGIAGECDQWQDYELIVDKIEVITFFYLWFIVLTVTRFL